MSAEPAAHYLLISAIITGARRVGRGLAFMENEQLCLGRGRRPLAGSIGRPKAKQVGDGPRCEAVQVAGSARLLLLLARSLLLLVVLLLLLPSPSPSEPI